MRGSKRIGISTVEKNNGERKINYGIKAGYRCLAYRIERAYERRRRLKQT